MIYPIPRWMDRQLVSIYYDEEESSLKKGGYIAREVCGICHKSLIEGRKKRGIEAKKVISTEIDTKGMITVGKESVLFYLHMMVCGGCIEKYNLKSSKERSDAQEQYNKL